ncbi:hypothetical protein BV22DRAFT_1042390 [Leucogyrophana mollusca]|uniref:Uncharacterized protein n=1 Tax=Leucogyrophana mollusca TaxID=85980 RepID=A0ACB8AV39_9AGAM|nr:hypothetical protein BV22DRAFT_1042390 [Leucogyrophana mollusca]
MRYFNRYTYTEIALYGKPYILSATGIDALVNDPLVSMTPTQGVYPVGRLCSLFAYL